MAYSSKTVLLLSLAAAACDGSDPAPADAGDPGPDATACLDIIGNQTFAPDPEPKFWRVRGDRRDAVLPTAVPSWVTSPDRRHVAYLTDDGSTLHVVDLDQRSEETHALPAPHRLVTWSRAGLIATTGPTILVVDPDTGAAGRTLFTYTGGPSVPSIRIAPDDSRAGFAMGGAFHQAILDGRSGDFDRDLGTGGSRFYGWSASGRHVAFLGDDSTHVPFVRLSRVDGGPGARLAYTTGDARWSPATEHLIAPLGDELSPSRPYKGTVVADASGAVSFELGPESGTARWSPGGEVVWIETSSRRMRMRTLESAETFDVLTGWTGDYEVLGRCTP